MSKENEQKNLILTRFCGEEIYPIETATWHLYENKDGLNELWLEIESDFGIQLSDDTKDLGGQPHWELTFRIKDLKKSELKVGFRATIKNGYDEELEDSLTNFYYCEHQPTDNNEIEIIDINETKILFRIIGEVTDVNYYDGSKPKNKIYVETWFDED
ncbi:hypothetical protein [Soonwooa sp.]|uniref:hypothetical protein n=1 Tax=Soonwooa sp. TaxID=1938592 RepID=UPI00262B38DA|nr:hypothetical protein [Soonwooa sp.]